MKIPSEPWKNVVVTLNFICSYMQYLLFLISYFISCFKDHVIRDLLLFSVSFPDEKFVYFSFLFYSLKLTYVKEIF